MDRIPENEDNTPNESFYITFLKTYNKQFNALRENECLISKLILSNNFELIIHKIGIHKDILKFSGQDYKQDETTILTHSHLSQIIFTKDTKNKKMYGFKIEFENPL